VNVNEISEFLRGVAPFDLLEVAQLESVAMECTPETYAAGTTILIQGSAPSTCAWVIREGAVELADEGRVIDQLGAEQMFGHRSMLTGEPISLGVRALEETTCYRIPDEVVRPVLAQPSSLRHLVLSVSGRYEMRAREGLSDAAPSRRPVGDIARKGVVLCDPETTVRELANEMAAADTSLAVVNLRDGYGVVTDHDLRVRVVAAGVGPDTPAREVMTAPARTAGADCSGADVLIDMVEYGLGHLPVIDARGAVIGVITISDLIAASVRTPFQLRSAIAQAEDEVALAAAASRLPEAVIALYEARLPARVVSGVITSAHDAATRRLIEIAEEELGPRPAPFTWFTLGSFARREAFPDSDQDNALTWDAPVEDDDTRGWMANLATRVVSGLEAAGIKPCKGGALATKPLFARPIGDWERLARSWLDDPDQEKALILVSLVGDGRAVHGDDTAATRMRTAFADAQNHPRLLRLLEIFALADRPPTGFRRNIVVDQRGEHQGTLDIKKRGLLPIVDLARSAALAVGVAGASTSARLDAAEAACTIPASDVSVLRDAFDLITELRMQHQVDQLRRGQVPDNHLDPATLTPLVQTYLREAFRATARVQRGIRGSMQYGVRNLA
jgi:CBS domain-containing protein